MEVHIEFEDGDTEYYYDVQWVETENGNVNITYFPEVEKDNEDLENTSIKYAEIEAGY